MHAMVATAISWIIAAVDEVVVEGQPEDMRHMLSGVRLIGIVALIFLVALLIWVIKKI